MQNANSIEPEVAATEHSAPDIDSSRVPEHDAELSKLLLGIYSDLLALQSRLAALAQRVFASHRAPTLVSETLVSETLVSETTDYSFADRLRILFMESPERTIGIAELRALFAEVPVATLRTTLANFKRDGEITWAGRAEYRYGGTPDRMREYRTFRHAPRFLPPKPRKPWRRRNSAAEEPEQRSED